MITRRDLSIAAAAALVTACSFMYADQKPMLHSMVVGWDSVPEKQTESGSVRTFIDARTPTLEHLDVHVTTLKPGLAPHAPHRHGHEELLIIKEGAVEALINGQWKTAGPGSVILLASNELHGVRNSGSTPATYHVIGFQTSTTPPDAK